MGWTGWSYTAEDKVSGKNSLKEDLIEEPTPKDDSGRHVAGIVTGNQDYGTKNGESDIQVDNTDEIPGTGFTNSWKLNLILGILSCWVAMTLTGWGSIQSGGDVANPDVGRVSMWMIITSQWIVMLLYTASLAGIVLIFVYFSGCGTNEAFVSVTLVMAIVVTVAQLSGDEGSLLSSGVIVGYSVFLCYTAGTFFS